MDKAKPDSPWLAIGSCVSLEMRNAERLLGLASLTPHPYPGAKTQLSITLEQWFSTFPNTATVKFFSLSLQNSLLL